MGILLIIEITAVRTSLQAQGKDSIKYFIPDTVNAKILEYLKGDKSDVHFYAILQCQNDTTSILISSYNPDEVKLLYLIKNSNRYIKLNSKRVIPLVLQSDLLFSEVLHSIKNKGKYNETMSHTDINPGGFSVVYTGMYDKVSLIKTRYYQY